MGRTYNVPKVINPKDNSFLHISKDGDRYDYVTSVGRFLNIKVGFFNNSTFNKSFNEVENYKLEILPEITSIPPNPVKTDKVIEQTIKEIEALNLDELVKSTGANALLVTKGSYWGLEFEKSIISYLKNKDLRVHESIGHYYGKNRIKTNIINLYSN